MNEKEDGEGYIYIMENSYYNRNDMYKVGYSINPYNRAKELSSATGVVGKFHVIKMIPVLNMKKSEDIIHYILKSTEVIKNKEFFEISYDKLLDIVIKSIECANIIVAHEKDTNFKQIQKSVEIKNINVEEQSKNIAVTPILKFKKMGKAKIKIIGFIYKNKEIITHIRKEALKMVCDDLASSNKDFYEKVKSLKYFSKDEKKFPTLAYKVKGTDIYVKTNLCANDVEKQTREILSLFGYSQDILKFNYK